MLRVLTYHRVCDPARASDSNPSVVSATSADFEQQVQYLAAHYHVVSAEAVLSAFSGGKPLPRRAVLVSFDDAYRDFGDIAWPILRRYGMPAVLFVATAYPDQPEREFWWDRLHRAFKGTRRTGLHLPTIAAIALETPDARRASLRRLQNYLKTIPHPEAMQIVDQVCAELYSRNDGAPRGSSVMGWDELRAVAADGVVVAAHTQTHPALTRVSTEEALREIRGSREDIRRELGTVPPIFSYPFGLHDERVAALVREAGFEAAVTCLDGQNDIASADPLRLRRTNITRRSSHLLFRLRLLRPISYLDRWRHRALPHA